MGDRRGIAYSSGCSCIDVIPAYNRAATSGRFAVERWIFGGSAKYALYLQKMIKLWPRIWPVRVFGPSFAEIRLVGRWKAMKGPLQYLEVHVSHLVGSIRSFKYCSAACRRRRSAPRQSTPEPVGGPIFCLLVLYVPLRRALARSTTYHCGALVHVCAL